MSSRLKAASSLKALRSSGSLFHNVGAAAEKALSPYVLVRVVGIASKFASDDLRARGAGLGFIRSLMYCGAAPCMALKVVSTILYSILFSIGNQCNSTKIGVIWFEVGVKVKILAAILAAFSEDDHFGSLVSHTG